MARAVRSTRWFSTPILELEHALVRGFTRDLERRALIAARRSAVARFARSHSLWYQSLFDHTLLHDLPLDRRNRRPASLARAWTMQFRYRNEGSRERDVERLEPVAASFLELLREEEERLLSAEPFDHSMAR